MNLFFKGVRLINKPVLILKILISFYDSYQRKKIYKKNYINGSLNNSIILASYPKSGNTYFRLLWMNIINDIEEINKKVDYELIDDLLPNEQYVNDLNLKWKFKSLPCLLKVHKNYEDYFENLRSIHLFRNPFDTMISNYYYFSNRSSGPSSSSLPFYEKMLNNDIVRFKGNLSTYIQKEIDLYFTHFISWMNSNAIPISYEKLTSDSAPHTLKDLLDKLKIKSNSLDIKNLKKAIYLSSIKKTKEFKPSEKMAKLENISFARKGKSGGWKKELSVNDVELILQKMNIYFKYDNYQEAYQKFIDKWREDATHFLNEKYSKN